MQVFTSNRIEILFAHLVQTLKPEPFKQIKILVPSPALKEWLTFKLAEELGILFGFKIELIEDAFSKGVSLTELTFEIEHAMKDIPELKNFYKIPARRHFIAKRLAALFLKYSRNVPRMKTEWTKGWQAELYQKLFRNRETAWEEVSKGSFPEYWLFGVSYLTPIEKIAFKNSLIWLFSPCLHFWEDQLSEKEGAYLLRELELKGVKERDLEELQEYLTPINPLLVSWGRLGKRMSLLEEGEERLFAAAESQIKRYQEWDLGDTLVIDEETSTLQLLQSDILYGRRPDIQERSDSSVTITSYLSLKKEVEGLSEQIITLLNDSKDEPQDILILTPDLEKLEPYLPLIFKNEIPYFIADRPHKNREAEAFLLFWNWALNRFHKEDFLDWLNHPSTRSPFDQDGLKILNDWIRKKPVEKEWDGKSYSWTAFLKSWSEEISSGHIQTSEIETLRQFIGWIEEIKKWIEPIQQKEEKSFSEWSQFFKESLKYCKSSEILEAIVEVESKAPPYPLSFYTVFQTLKERIEHSQYEGHPSNLNSVRISSLYPMRLVPYEHIFLVGMDEASFPRKDIKEPLDESRDFEEEKLASKHDLDRTLILESLLSARKSFSISFSESPSPLVEEFKEYLETYYPPFNIQEGKKDRIKYYPPEKMKLSYTLAPISQDKTLISVKELTDSFKNPIKVYLNTVLKLIFEREVEEEPFLIPNALERYLYVRGAFSGAERELSVKGRFTKAWIQRSEEDLKSMGSNPEIIHLDPPLEINGKTLFGSLKYVSDRGAFILNKGVEERIAAIPIIYLNALLQGGKPRFQQVGLKDKELEVSTDLGLAYVLKHFSKVREKLCPLEPRWISDIAKGHKEELSKKMDEENDPYIKWAISQGLKAENIIEEWKEEAVFILDLIGGLKDA